MSASRDLVVYVMATFLVGGAMVGSFGVLDVRAEQGASWRAARLAQLAALEDDAAGDVVEEPAALPAAEEAPATPLPVSVIPALAPPADLALPVANATPPTPPPASPAAEPTLPSPPPAVAPAPTTPPPKPSAPAANATKSPADTDGDRIVDSVDKCPTKRETRNGYRDTDGCPDVVTTTRVS